MILFWKTPRIISVYTEKSQRPSQVQQRDCFVSLVTMSRIPESDPTTSEVVHFFPS